MTAHTWGTPELGTYFLRHAGHDLEVKRVPKSGKGESEKQYQVIVNGILTDMAWSTTEGKTKAIKAAERAHKGEPILAISERNQGRSDPIPETAPDPIPDEMEPPRSAASWLNRLNLDVDVMEKPLQAEPVAAIPCGCRDDRAAGVSFTISGTLSLDTTEALNTIQAAVELLAEHGTVDGDAIVPRRVTFRSGGKP